MAECLVLCEMGLEELSEMQMRCQSLAEQCETLENLGFVDFFGLEERTIPCKIRQGPRAYRCLFGMVFGTVVPAPLFWWYHSYEGLGASACFGKPGPMSKLSST